ncbi:MAG TPA: hypothetical protein VEC10_15005 [Steroidobacteraceae bacterium]|nr:hypothetical protein [Steroidobacteraceae bacterium]
MTSRPDSSAARSSLDLQYYIFHGGDQLEPQQQPVDTDGEHAESRFAGMRLRGRGERLQQRGIGPLRERVRRCRLASRRQRGAAAKASAPQMAGVRRSGVLRLRIGVLP